MASRDCPSIRQVKCKRLELYGIAQVANLINLHADIFTLVPFRRQAAQATLEVASPSLDHERIDQSQL